VVGKPFNTAHLFFFCFYTSYPYSFLLTNSTDRVIRHFEVPAYQPPSAESEAASEYIEQDIEPLYKFADPVDKVSWNGIGYSNDAEWVIAGR
jgi:COMPASS component SWD1